MEDLEAVILKLEANEKAIKSYIDEWGGSYAGLKKIHDNLIEMRRTVMEHIADD